MSPDTPRDAGETATAGRARGGVGLDVGALRATRPDRLGLTAAAKGAAAK